MGHEPSRADIQAALDYDPALGKFYWSEGRKFPGKEAGSVWRQGRTRYRVIAINEKKFYAHRLAWLFHYGEWPDGDIDHIDGDGLNNHISNLRVVSRAENIRNCRQSTNNRSGVTGVFWSSQAGKWQAQIKVNRRKHHLGFFTEIEMAAKARKQAEKRFGFHKNHGIER